MSPDPTRAKSIFLAALERPAGEARDAFLADECGGDADLRREVDELVAHSEPPASFLEAPEVACTVDAPRAAETAGTVIGPYKLLQQIGEGGMGTVFMAEQSHPIQRKVALKIIKAGMDSRQVVARFEAERQALAMMDHVNIARVFDAGATETGRPYFVMELVHGVPITKYCDDNHLTPRERLELFVPVCQAIQHAHQKGIIHRDIKPSNVMVTLYDGKPVPKVIDFGVAKATEQKLTERTLFTQYGTMVGTLEYMSPEQAEMSALGVDTRSDIFSLGVLLYELLTGGTPLSRKRLKEAAYGEILRMIREEEAPKPSTRLSDSGEALASISAQRHMEPAKLAKLMRGELDWIVMKCLEKDRNRRYETANGFAADVQRYLNDEAIQACPPSARYRLRKFARRNKRALITTAAVVLAFLVAAGTFGWAVRDRAASEEKIGRERSAQQVKINHDVEVALHEALSLGERAATMTGDPHQWEAMLTAALSAVRQAETQMARDEAAIDPALREQVEQVKARLESAENDRRFVARYEQVRLERAQVDVTRNRFGGDRLPALLEDAFAQYGIRRDAMSPAEAAAVIGRRPAAVRGHLVAALYDWLYTSPAQTVKSGQWLFDALAAADSDPWRTRVIRAMKDRDRKAVEGLLAEDAALGQPPSFLILVAKSLPQDMEAATLALLERAQRAHPGDFWANHDLAYALHHAHPPQLEKAVRYYTAALALRPRNPGVYVNLGVALDDKGDFKGGIVAHRQAIAIDPRYAGAHHNLGSALEADGDADGAAAAYREALALDPTMAESAFQLGNVLAGKGDEQGAAAAYRQAIAADPKHAKAHHNLGNMLQKKGHREGDAFYQEAIVHYRESIALDPMNPFPHNGLGNVLKHQRNLKGAIEEYQKAIKVGPRWAEGHYNLGIALDETGDPGGAVAAYRRAIALDSRHAKAHSNLGNLLSDMGDLDGAIEHFRTAVDLMPRSAAIHSNLGLALVDRGDVDAGIEHCRKAVDLDPKLAEAHHNLGRGLHRQGKLEEAIDCYRKAIELDPKNAKANSNLGNALSGQRKLDEALACYRKAIELDPKNAGSHNDLAWLLATGPDPKLRDPKRAVELAQKAVELAPKEGNYRITLGMAHYRAGDWKAAVAALEKSGELRKGGDSFDWFFLAMAHWQLGKKEEARKWYDRAIEWMEKNKPKDEELRRFREEAAKLLKVDNPSKPVPKSK